MKNFTRTRKNCFASSTKNYVYKKVKTYERFFFLIKEFFVGLFVIKKATDTKFDPVIFQRITSQAHLGDIFLKIVSCI